LQIYIIPTYSCNLKCKKCYSEKYLEDFPDYLSWAKFIDLYKLFGTKYNNFAFIGGEPTKWKFINESILFLHNKNKYVNIFTNGIIPLQVVPNNVIINANNIFNLELKESIIRNILYYKRNRAKIRLRFNIGDDFKSEHVDEAILLSNNYADSVSISVLYPMTNSESLGNKIYEISKKLYSKSIPVTISRATPLCLFDQEQRNFLKTHCKLKGKCPLPTNSIVVNPDGNTIQPCVELQLQHRITDLSKIQPKKIFNDELNKLKINHYSKCNECDFFLNDECWGGCLSYLPPQ